MSIAFFLKKINNMLARVSSITWVWLVIVTAILFTAAISIFTVNQWEFANRFNTEISLLRQARIDLVKGYLYVTLDSSAAAPFDRSQGMALIDQARVSLEQALSLQRQNFGETSAGASQVSLDQFINDVQAFDQALDDTRSFGSNDVAAETRRRIAFYALEQHAGEVDNQLQADLNNLQLRNTRMYASFLGSAGVLLIVLCLAVFAGARARQQAERELLGLEQRFREMLEGVQLTAVILDTQGRIVFCNDYLLQLAGYERGELTGQDWFERLLPEGSQAVKDMFSQSLKSGQIPLRFENTILTRSGEQRLISLHNILLKDSAGTVTGIASLGIDVTERRKDEDALLRSNERLQVVLDSIPVMIALFSPDLKHQYVNRCWQDTLGWRQEELQNIDFMAELYPDPEYRQQVQDFINACSNTWMDLRTHTRDGSVLDTSWINLPLADGSGVGIGINLTERRQSESKLREQNEELRRWHAISLGREARILELKDEVNSLLKQYGQPPRYASLTRYSQSTAAAGETE
jgi:PAS domain S-box-containing protein